MVPSESPTVGVVSRKVLGVRIGDKNGHLDGVRCPEPQAGCQGRVAAEGKSAVAISVDRSCLHCCYPGAVGEGTNHLPVSRSAQCTFPRRLAFLSAVVALWYYSHDSALFISPRPPPISVFPLLSSYLTLYYLR